MKKYVLGLASLLGVFGMAHAQLADDIWSVFEPVSKQESTVGVSNAVIASVVADDDREEITGKADKLERAVVVLEMNMNGRKALCSGAMVAPNVVLTAAHCLNHEGQFMNSVDVFAVGMPRSGRNNPEPDVKSNPNPNPSASQPELPSGVRDIINKKPNNKKGPQVRGGVSPDSIKRIISHKLEQQEVTMWSQGDIEDMIRRLRQGGYPSAKAAKLWVPQEWIRLTRGNKGGSVDIDREERYDYGILVLEEPLGNQTGWLGLAVKSTSELRNASIVVVGRGGDKPARSLWEGKGRVGEVHDTYFFHNADQVGGNSGGPIFDVRDRSRIIALANFGAAAQRVSGGYPNGGLRITNKIVNAVNKAK